MLSRLCLKVAIFRCLSNPGLRVAIPHSYWGWVKGKDSPVVPNCVYYISPHSENMERANLKRMIIKLLILSIPIKKEKGII